MSHKWLQLDRKNTRHVPKKFKIRPIQNLIMILIGRVFRLSTINSMTQLVFELLYIDNVLLATRLIELSLVPFKVENFSAFGNYIIFV